jgi:RNA polymerase sigma-70 factor (ECF subfamily)
MAANDSSGMGPTALESRETFAPLPRQSRQEAAGTVPTDIQLLQMVRRGDPAGAEALFERHAPSILGFAGRMLGTRHDAEEICQEVFLKMIASAHQYDERAPLMSWLLSIAANACRDQLRQRKRTSPLPLSSAEHLAAPTPSAASTLLDEERRRSVERALQALSPEQREAVVLARYHGLPYQRVAEALGITEGAVKTRISRAVQTLRGLLSDDETITKEEDRSWTAAKPGS